MAVPNPDVSSLATKTFDALFAQMRNELQTKNTKLFRAEITTLKNEAKAQLRDSLSDQVKKVVSGEIKQAVNALQQKQTAEWNKSQKQHDALIKRVDDLDKKFEELIVVTEKSRSAVEKVINKKVGAMERLIKDQTVQLERQVLKDIGETQEALALQVDHLTITREELNKLQHMVDDMNKTSETAVDDSSEVGELPVKEELPDLLCLDNEDFPGLSNEALDSTFPSPDEGKAKTENSALQALITLLDNIKLPVGDRSPIETSSQQAEVSTNTGNQAGVVTRGDEDDSTSDQQLASSTTSDEKARTTCEADTDEIRLPEHSRRSY